MYLQKWYGMPLEQFFNKKFILSIETLIGLPNEFSVQGKNDGILILKLLSEPKIYKQEAIILKYELEELGLCPYFDEQSESNQSQSSPFFQLYLFLNFHKILEATQYNNNIQINKYFYINKISLKKRDTISYYNIFLVFEHTYTQQSKDGLYKQL
ncbi:hypothetical protein ABPG74_017194 [Tetrahymena malaccensis]